MNDLADRFDWYEPHQRWVASGGAEGARANLAGANLADANLAGADLTAANLSRAYLAGAYLGHAKGIAAIGPVGREGRMIYAVDHGDRVMIQAGCRWATADVVRAAVRADYADDPREVAYLAAIDAIEAIVIAGRAA